MDARDIDTLPLVRATLNYLKPMAAKPNVYIGEPPPGTPPFSGEVDVIDDVPIHDARPLIGELTLDVQGFAFRHHETAVADLYDETQLKSIYYPEMEQLLKEATGAEEVLVFDHTFRAPPAKGIREPVRRVHNDYTDLSGPQRVRDLLEPKEAEERLKHRFAEVNVWRPITPLAQDVPLAVCDARTLSAADLVATDLIYRDRLGEIFNVTYSSRHKWFYFPNMRRDEVVFLKCYDSARDGRARLTVHTAFDDPTAPADAIPRESIEIRALLFFQP